MRTAIIALVGLAASALSANAAPAVPGSVSNHDANIVTVAGGCGPGFHPTPWGRCVPFRHVYRGWRYYGDSDFMAEQLNSQELSRLHWGY